MQRDKEIVGAIKFAEPGIYRLGATLSVSKHGGEAIVYPALGALDEQLGRRHKYFSDGLETDIPAEDGPAVPAE